ncbi:MAG: carbamoyl phosphate synthase small subunit [Eubacteriales bacterium]
MSTPRYLILEDGKVFKGRGFGASGEVTAEIVFTTGMTGYLETLTDKSYYGQIIVQSFPLIGNYGVIPSDFESGGVEAKGYIVKHWCEEPSNFRSEGDLDTFFKTRGIVGLSDIDTRALVKIIREHGVMNGMITDNPDGADLEKIKSYKVTDAVSTVSSTHPLKRESEDALRRVVLMDFGLKENIARELSARGCEVTVMPQDSTPEQVLAQKPDGIMLSNGPGDPEDNPDVIKNLSVLMNTGVPIFGICLGHQLLALAAGFRTSKLKYGHRGANQPVQDKGTGRIYISSQNHGYAVLSDTINPEKATELFINLNDNTCEGIEYKDIPVFSVQFHPEACGGPHDTAFLFDRFVKLIDEYRK